jgi:hypothetical protein
MLNVMSLTDSHRTLTPHTGTSAAATSGALQAAQAVERLRSTLMRQSLTHLLNGVPGARLALPHLAALEQALIEHGTAVLSGLSRPALVAVCRQLAALPLPVDDVPLQDLQERLLQALDAAAVSEVPTPAQRNVNLHELSDFLTEEKLLVADASYDDFAAAAAGFATTQRCSL